MSVRKPTGAPSENACSSRLRTIDTIKRGFPASNDGSTCHF